MSGVTLVAGSCREPGSVIQGAGAWGNLVVVGGGSSTCLPISRAISQWYGHIEHIG